MFFDNPGPEHRRKRLCASVLSGLLLCSSLMFSGLALVGHTPAHASKGPMQPHKQVQSKLRAKHTSQAPPDIVSKLTHTGEGSFPGGSNVNFTLQVSNAATAGPVVNTTDTPNFIRAIVFFPKYSSNNVDATGTNWSCDGSANNVICNYTGPFPVAPGTNLPPISVTENLNANPAPSVMASNTAYTLYEKQDTYANNYSTDTIQTTGNGQTPLDDLSIKATHSPDGPFLPGSTVTFTLTATNNGTGQYSDYADIRGVFPPGLSNITPVSSPAGFSCTVAPSPGHATVTRMDCDKDEATLAPGDSITQTVTATVNSAPPEYDPEYTIEARIIAIHATAVGGNTADTIQIVQPPDLQTEVTNDTDSPQGGQPMSYTMTVSNVGAGPVMAGSPITATFTPPAAAAMSNVTADGGPDWDIAVDPTTGKVTATYKGTYPVTAGQSLTPIKITGTPTKGATGVVGTGTVTTPNDSSADNNTATCMPQDITPPPTPTPVPAPDLKTVITNDTDNPQAGLPINYTMTLSNVGDGVIAAGDTITATFTPSSDLSNVTADGGPDWDIAVDATTGKVTATYKGTYPVTAGQSLTPIKITGTPLKAATGVTADGSASTPNDGNSDNNTATSAAQDIAAATPPPDLSIAMNTTTSGQVGVPDTFTVTATNGILAGPVQPGQPIVITFTPPDGFNNVTATCSKDWKISVDPTTGKVTATYIGPYPVKPGQQLPPISIVGIPTKAADPATSTATVTTPNDSNLPNNSTSLPTQTIVPAPDLAVAIQHDGDLQVNTPAKYTVQVSDLASAGPVPAGQPIAVIFTPPAGLSNVSADGGKDWQTTVDAASGTVTAIYSGDYPIATGQQLPALTITGTPTTVSSSIASSATVITTNDSNLANNTTNGAKQVVHALPDLSIKLSDPTTTLQVGVPTTYIVQVSNSATAGSVSAGQPITVKFTPPAGFSNVSASSGNDWKFDVDATTGMVTATYTGAYPIQSGQALGDITITGTPSQASTSVTTSATVTLASDSDTSNNTANGPKQVIRPAPDLAVSVQAASAPFKVSMSGKINVQVSNNNAAGPVADGNPISVTITLPAGTMTQLQASGTDWDTSVDASTNTIKAVYKGDYPIDPNATLPMITITGIPTTSAVPSITVSSTVSVNNDSNPADNTASATITVQPVKPRPAINSHRP